MTDAARFWLQREGRQSHPLAVVQAVCMDMDRPVCKASSSRGSAFTSVKIVNPRGAYMSKSLDPERLRELARDGAGLALQRLRAEIIAIERTFPELAIARKRRALRRSLKAATNRTSRMSAAARKAVSERMKRYWAERRKATAKVK
jgi:hypothetical protein